MGSSSCPVFMGCNNFRTLKIGDSVQSILNYTFKGCSSITSLISNSINPPIIQSNTFYGVSTSIPITVPCNSIQNYQSSNYWNNFINYRGIDDQVHTIYAEICQGEAYNQFGFNESNAGFYTQNFQTTNGCDSIVNLNLMVNPIYNDTIIAEICSNETYTLNGFNENTTGFYTQNLQTTKGCDSIVNLTLIVNPIYLVVYLDNICKGYEYNNYGFNFIADTSGVYTRNYQTNNGCDSVFVLNLVVNPTPVIPTALSVQVMTNFIEITWQSNGSSYIIYRNNDSLTTVNMPIYLDYNVINGQPYCYKIKAINGDCESEFSNVVCKSFSGLNEISSSNIQTKLYPNPTNNKSKLEVEGLSSDADVIVYDLFGRVIKSYKINPTNNELEIDVNGFAKGVYNIRIMNDKISISRKLIVN